MDSSLIMLILNLVLLVVVIVGFLFGLHGVKKSALSLAFFVGAFIVTLIITPFVTKALLQINITVDGSTMSISDYIMETVRQSALVKDLATQGSNMEALIENAPQILGNIATYMALLIVVGLIFWIAYLITAHALFKKKQATNPVTKETPANVSATGNVKYVKTEKPEDKHRLLGGLVGAVHAFLFLVFLLIPAVGATSLFGSYAYAQESDVQTTAIVKTLDVSGTEESANSESEIKYTPTAKYIQEKVSPEVLDIISAVNHSIIGSVCQVADVGDVVFNSVAKCKVNGERVVLKDELDKASKVYDNTEFLFSIDFSSVESIRSINFDKVRTAINTLTDSSLLKSIAPELTNKYLDWLTAEDISSLDQEVQDMLANVRKELDDDPNLKELVVAIKNLLGTDEKIMATFKKELLNVVDICQIVVDSDLLEYIVEYRNAETEIDLTNEIVTCLHANNNALINSLIDKIYSSDFVNLFSLTSINYAIDEIQSVFQHYIDETSIVNIAKIQLLNAQSKMDASVLKTIADAGFDFYLKLDASKDSNDEYDVDKFVKENIVSIAQNIGKALDDVKDMAIINEFGTLDNILTNLDKIEITINDEEPTTISKCLVNLSLIKNKDFKFETELKSVGELAEYLFKINFTETVDGEEVTYSFYDKVKDKDFEYILKNLSSEDIKKVVNTLTDSEFFKPLGVYTLNYVNKEIQKQVGKASEEIGDLLPGDVDLSGATDQIIDIIDDVKDALTVVDDFDDNKSLEENLKTITDTADQEKIAGLLSGLQDNASQEDSVFKDLYDSMLEQLQDDEKSGLDGLSKIIEDSTTDGTIDWSKVVSDYVNKLNATE